MTALDFHHVFAPGEAGKPALLLLHGTGGDENDLVGLGQTVAPGFPVLSPRGKVLENGMPRFFRRMSEGVFDLEDLRVRTDELADFIKAARAHYKIEDRPIIALGFSNGANIAASLLLQRPEILDGAILLRAMTPFKPDVMPDLSGKRILMLSGLMDQIVPAQNASTLASMFVAANARVTAKSLPASHNLGAADIAEMKGWLGS